MPNIRFDYKLTRSNYPHYHQLRASWLFVPSRAGSNSKGMLKIIFILASDLFGRLAAPKKTRAGSLFQLYSERKARLMNWLDSELKSLEIELNKPVVVERRGQDSCSQFKFKQSLQVLIMQITSRQHIDFFKVFKILELKKIDKQGEVKLVLDKMLGRRVLSIEGSVSTQNYIVFDCSELVRTQPALSFSQRYLYVVGWVEVSKVFCFQVTLGVNGKAWRALYSTVHKVEKVSSQGVLQMPLELKSNKWSIIVIDLHELCGKYLKLDEARLNFELKGLEIRAHSRIKNVYLSDNLFDPSRLPKDMQLPLKPGEDYFMKYNYLILPNTSPNSKQYATQSDLHRDLFEAANHQVDQNLKGIENKIEVSQVKVGKSTKPKKASQPMKLHKNISGDQSAEFGGDAEEEIPATNKAPKPLTTIDLKLWAMEGHSLCANGVRSLGAFITCPSVHAVHKFIKCMSIHMSNSFRLVMGYEDGSVCIWDMVRQRALVYLKTDLEVITQILAKGEGEGEKIYLVGLDKMRRETILICNTKEVLFRQISNYSIHQFLLCTHQNQQVIVSYGFENIRLWKMNQLNHIITGSGLYLGKLNRRVLYTSACAIGQDKVLVADSSGYVTTVSLLTEKVQSVQKVSENGLDRILNISEQNCVIVAESNGTLKVLSYGLEVLEHYELGNRVKSMCYRSQEGSIKLQLCHYNCSTAVLDVGGGCYEYQSSQHREKVVGLAYNSRLNRVISIGQDNTIRVWALLKAKSGKRSKLEYQLKQQYEFLVNSGEKMSSLAADENVSAYVGFEGGLVRKINIQEYGVEGEKSFLLGDVQAGSAEQARIKSIKVSRNNRHLLISVSRTSSPGYVILSDQLLSIVYKYDPPESGMGKCCQFLAGFSETHKKTFMCWSDGVVHRFQIFSLTEDLGRACRQFYLQSAPLSIRYVNECVEVDGSGKCFGVFQTYDADDGQLVRAINTGKYQERSIRAPFMAFYNGHEQLQLSLLHSGTTKTIDIPEPVNNIVIYPLDEKLQKQTRDSRGLIICSGQQTHALYAMEFQARNLETNMGMSRLPKQNQLELESIHNQNDNIDYCQSPEEQEQELECAEKELILFNNTQNSNYGQNNQEKGHTQTQSPSQLKPASNSSLGKLYQKQEDLYNQFTSSIQPNLLPSAPTSDGEPAKQRNSQLMYGWSNIYSSTKVGSTRMVWHPSNRSVLFLNESTLILHYFKEPVSQKFVRLPFRPSLIVPLGGSLIGVGLGNQLRVYTSLLQHMKSFLAVGDIVSSVCLSNCQGYLIVLSNSNSTRKEYIQVIDIVTGATVSSTYRCRKDGPGILECNPFQHCMQFILYTGRGVSFYRLTSILTLQTQELAKIQDILSSTDIGGICCATYLKLGEEETILLGMQDGSIVVVDSRANSILMLCKRVCNHAILDILYYEAKSETSSVSLALVTNSTNVLGYELENATLNELVSKLDKPPIIKLNADSELTLHSKLEMLGGNNLGMIAMTKFGVLWLLDFTGHHTIKVLSVHSPLGAISDSDGSIITKGLVIEKENMDPRIITGCGDGCVKETLLRNLEQTNEIYRPRRYVYDILLADELLIVAFGLELYFQAAPYKDKHPTLHQEWKFIGSVSLLELHEQMGAANWSKHRDFRVAGIKHIPFSDNFIVCTSSKLLMLYYQKTLSGQSGKLKVEMKEICCGLEKAKSVQLMGFNYILVREPAKITTWARKQRRGVSVLEQMCKLDELAYYMADVYQVEASCVKFAPTKNSRQYIVIPTNKAVLEWRDFEQHCIIRTVEVAVCCGIRSMEIGRDGQFLVGDEEGTVWSIKENGLTLNKIKVFDSPVEGIAQMNNGQLMAYGPCAVITKI